MIDNYYYIKIMDNINLEKIIKSEEIDQNIILDVPESIGLKIMECIEDKNFSYAQTLEIIQSYNDNMTLDESRKLVFMENNTLHPAVLLDYPCIIEGQKTLDNKTFYKTGDICQMLYVHENKLDSIEDIKDFNSFKANDKVFNNIIWFSDIDHKYKLKHGLTKATRNIRFKRFKTQQRYDKEELSIVCKKLKDIIDNGAAKFEKSLLNQPENDQVDVIETENHSVYSAIQMSNQQNKSNKIIISSDSKDKNLIVQLPLREDKEVGLVESKNTDSSIKDMENEYFSLKEQYNKLKQELEIEDDQEKIKLRKKIKKKLKQIKAIIANDNDGSSN